MGKYLRAHAAPVEDSFPGPTSGCSQSPLTPVNPTPYSGLGQHLHLCAHILKQTHLHTHY